VARTIVITGGNSGIGLAAASRLARRGNTVAITARDERKGRQALREIQKRSRSDDVHLLTLDLASFESIRACAHEVVRTFDRLDALVCNAGAVLSTRRLTREGFEMTFGANHLGHFLLVSLLRDHLQATAAAHGHARVVVASSVAHKLSGGLRWDDLEYQRRVYDGSSAYNASKLANALFALELARRLDGTGVVSNCFHPGLVRTGFGGHGDTHGLYNAMVSLGRPFMIGQGGGAAPIVSLAADDRWAERTGQYVVRGYVPVVRAHRPSRFARDPANGRRLWEISEAMVRDAGG
jgi:NAD(P)-dependent dehydrogenase (short-subunit alcohol dehydrogenase family)